MTKPDLMAELAAYELVMVSGVSPLNNVSIGLFRNANVAKCAGDLLLTADKQSSTPEWISYTVTHREEGLPSFGRPVRCDL